MASSHCVNTCSLIWKSTHANRDISLNQENSLEDACIRKSWPQNLCAEPDNLELHFLSLYLSLAAACQPALSGAEWMEKHKLAEQKAYQ